MSFGDGESMPKSATKPGFTSSPAKDVIRNIIDHDLIKRFRHVHYPDEKLRYLGLPGVDLLDILSWREFLGYCTAVEESVGLIEDLELNVLNNHLEGMVHIVRGNITDLLAVPAESNQLQWPYQIVNLDFCGGLVHAQDSHDSQRLNALKNLFARQAGTAFLLFLTLNLKDKDKGELEELVKQQEDDLRVLDPEGVATCFMQHRDLGYAGLLKIYVPIFLLNEARRHSLNFIPPILYQGTKQMMHFAVECIPYTELGAGRVLTTQARISEINRPLHVLHSGDDLRRVELGHINISIE
jgi:hypothetical protein